MNKLHCYQILLLIGGLLAASLYATEEKYQKEASVRSFYEHGDLTFIEREKDNINEEELKQGLIDLSYRIKAKDNRKVYFFIGTSGVGKSLSIAALQGNRIKKVKIEQASSDSDSSDEAFWEIGKSPFEIEYRLPKHEVPAVGAGSVGQTTSSYIYYPDPERLEYKDIAFADTEGFLGNRKATSAEKCLSATSFFYTLKVNKVGGLVLVISAPELDAGRGQGVRRIAHILQQYFARAVSNQIIKESLLVMITKVDSKKGQREAIYKFRQHIQFFYQNYYADQHIFNLENAKGIGKFAIEKGMYRIKKLYGMSEEENRKSQEDAKKKKENYQLKLFFEMLLRQDVPKDKINDINNFKLDGKRFCFIVPWQEKSVQRILHKKLLALKLIASGDLCTFDNPVSQYMGKKIIDISMQLHHAIQPLLSQKRVIDRLEMQRQMMSSTGAISQSIHKLNEDIKTQHSFLQKIKQDNTLDPVFNQSHDERLPANQGWWSQCVAWGRGYKLAKEFKYIGKDPIYQIEATYGPEAALSEKLPSWFGGATHNKFIENHFKVTKKKDSNGKVTFKAITKSGKGIVKDTWCLYHITTGAHKAQCRITFYALRRERIATQMAIKSAEEHIKKSEISISFYKKANKDYKTLLIKREKEAKKWQEKKDIQTKTWRRTAQMLKFFADEILKRGADKDLIKVYLRDFREATQLKSFKSNHQQDKPHPEEEEDDVYDLFDLDNDPQVTDDYKHQEADKNAIADNFDTNDDLKSIAQEKEKVNKVAPKEEIGIHLSQKKKPLMVSLESKAHHKSQAAQQQVSVKSFYEHGDLTFIEREEDQVNKGELKQGLIKLFEQIKARDGRKVYFFIGATGAGKSQSIQALQGNIIKKIKDDTSDSGTSSVSLNDLDQLPQQGPFETEYVLPKHEVPVVGHTSTGKTDNTYIYYTDPKKLQHREVAFADTEGFFGKRKATSAEKCLSAISFFYTAKVNKVGGLVLVISKPELEAFKGDGVKRIAHILQQYFARAVTNQIMKKSLLVMITKVDSTSKSSRAEVLRKFRELIQRFYQEYYEEPKDKDFLQKSFDQIGKGGYNGIRQLVDKRASFKKVLTEKSKKQDENRHLKLFCEMLLAQDVPKDKIGDIENFTLDRKKFCFIFPWDVKRLQKILDKHLKSLKPIASDDLCTFDNPVSQYMKRSILGFNDQFSKEVRTNNYAMSGGAQKGLPKKSKDPLVDQAKGWEETAQMLEFFADEILEEGADKRSIKENLKHFRENNHQKNKPHPEKEDANFLNRASAQVVVNENELNPYQSADNEVFDID